MNRTNRSGILKAGVIGGLKQEGNYKLNCRFTKPDLIRKIKRIYSYREQLSLSQLDAVEFLQTVVPKTGKDTLVNLDPPYFGKGPDLHTNFYQRADHAVLAKAVTSICRPWIVTYDDTDEIRELYKQYPLYSNRLNYSAQTKRVGSEVIVLDPNLRAPKSLESMEIKYEGQRSVAEALA